MSIGATLRQARETKGLTCEDLSRATRIPLRLVLAIERDDWAKLPGGIFTRGYLRACAQEVGIDPEPLVARFEAEHAPPPPPPPEPEPDRRSAEDPWLLKIRWERLDLPAAAWQRRLAWPALAAAVLLVLYSVSGRAPADQAQSLPSGPSEGAADRAASSLGASEAAPVGTSANPGKQHDIELPPAGVETPLALEIEVTRPCWLTLTVDGTRQVFRVVQPGERERQQGREFVIRAGDAGAIQLALDGEPARALGASGEVLTVRITRENYRSLLESPSASLF